MKFFGVEEDALFGFEGFVFAGFGGGGLNFFGLKGPEVGEAKAVLLVALDFGEAGLDVAPAGEGVGGSVGRDCAEAVEEAALLGWIEAGEGFGLGVNESQLGSESAEDGDSSGLVVDVNAALAVGKDFAAEDDFVGIDVDAVGFEDELGAWSGFKDAREDSAVGSMTDDAGGGFLAHEEGESVDEDGFAGAGFAGEEIEAGAEAGDGVIDDGIILSSEFEQHGRL